jgi:protein-tyrosine phosphatase
VDDAVFDIHERLKGFPPAQLAYIVYRRFIEQGLRPTAMWIVDKVVRRTHGYSLPQISEVAPRLYVGGQQRRRGLARMRQQGITAVVNMRAESDDAARGVVPDRYLWLPTIDDTAPTLGDLHRGAAFIAEQIAAGRGVYVHCASGVGRAPTMAAAYLVSQGATAAEAWRTIRRGRPFVRPTPPQLAVIEAFADADRLSRADQALRES